MAKVKKNKRYRNAKSYRGKTPEARARQIAGLKGGDTAKYRCYKMPSDIIAFAEEHFYIPETRQPVILLDYEKRFFRDLFHAKRKPTLALLGTPKKCGKSTIAAMIALFTLVSKPDSETYIVGPDLEQTQLVVYSKIRKAIRMNPHLQKFISVKKDQITNKSNGSFIRPLACSSTNAGLNPTLCIFDELWRFTSDEAIQTYEELTNIPKEDNLNLIVTYAGFSDDEDSMLYELYKKGVDQRDGRAEKDKQFLFRWFNESLYKQVPWVTKNYLTLQKKRLRPNTFARFHQNIWSSGSESFVDSSILDACTHSDFKRGLVSNWEVAAGIDIGLKHDTSAIVLVGKISKDTLCVVDHKCFVPQKGITLDLEKTVEAAMLAYSKKYKIKVAFYDPFQFARSAKTLQNAGLKMIEYPQTPGNCVLMSETLSGLLNNQSLVLYENQELRQHLLNAEAKETPRGWRLVKRKQSKKIDLAISLAMACQAAQEKFLLKSSTPGKVFFGDGQLGGIDYGITKRTKENAGKGIVHII